MNPIWRKSVLALTACLSFSAAAAESYPDRPVRLIVPYAPGGATDLIARFIAEPLGRVLKQPVVVENKSGAGGMLGTGEVARSQADGYTLGIGTVSTMVIFPAVHPKPGYKVADFAPITNIAQMPNVIAVNPSFPANDLKEFIAVLKANPDKYSYATSGIGSINHMMGESFQAGAGVKIRHVPYRGAGPAMQDVMGGQVEILVDQLPSSKTFIDSGKLKLIGVIADKRVPAYPDVMTMQDVGIRDFNDQAWYGLIAPAGVPAPVMSKLSAAMQEVMAMPEVRQRLEAAGATPLGSSSQAYLSQINAEVEKMRALVKARNISLQE
ncbi:MAG: Bug family tripartite tricarboxylate transporter substrate binding protein [Achromobacter mucicolens]